MSFRDGIGVKRRSLPDSEFGAPPSLHEFRNKTVAFAGLRYPHGKVKRLHCAGYLRLWRSFRRRSHHCALPISTIISGFPEICAEFREKRFSLLSRGGRDGFEKQEFHRRCDGHANNLTLILDTKGNNFGGFSPVEWESRIGHLEKANDRLKCFVFTLKNPRKVSGAPTVME
jgi:hypothetical protein